MKQQLLNVLVTQGQTPIINSINVTIKDLKNSGYNFAEIKETIRECFFGLDGKIDRFII